MNRVEAARLFATAAHASVKQIRKYSFEPYIVHPAEVVRLVSAVPHTEEMLAAAWLHDVVEDTGVTLELIAQEFGEVVAGYVDLLTKRDSKENRAIRKAAERERLSKASVEVKTIKLADLISNTDQIVTYDPKFSPVFIREMGMLVLALKEGDATLWSKAQALVRDYYDRSK